MSAPLHEQVGFNYCGALLELLQRFTYDEIAEALGYASKASVSTLLAGAVPSHVHGEALWALYIDTFGRKPPLDVQRKARVRKNEPVSSTPSV